MCALANHNLGTDRIGPEPMISGSMITAPVNVAPMPRAVPRVLGRAAPGAGADLASRRILLVGASGRLGRLVRHHWNHGAGAGLLPVAQRRSAATGAQDLLWSPLSGSRALRDHVGAEGPIDAMVMMAGSTPRTDLPGDHDARLAVACIDAARAAGIRRVLLVSTIAVYGAQDDAPFCEVRRPNPITAYGCGKLRMEQAAVARAGRDVDLSILRLGNVAGADALLTTLARLAPGDPARVDTFADGRGPVRSYIGAETLARVLSTLLHWPVRLPPVLNIGAPIPVSMTDLARAAGFGVQARPGPDATPQVLTLDCTRLARFHRFTPHDSDPGVMVDQWRAAKGGYGADAAGNALVIG